MVAMDISPLPQGFGALITGFDLQSGAGEAQVSALQDAYDTHHLLVFHGDAPIAPERHVEIASWFGPVGANRDAEGRPWTVLDNEQEVGAAVLPFHCDITYMEHPFAGLSLHPVAMPTGGSSTTFVSNGVGWDHLADDLKALLHDRRVLHKFHDHAMVEADWPELAQWHPARLVHAKTGREMLFVTENHVREIEGLSEAESAPHLTRVFATQYAPERQYEHYWQAGDLLVWNNVAIQHARTRPAAPSAGRRIIQRVAMGTHGFGEQIAAVMAAA